jgi:hypothetical protein
MTFRQGSGHQIGFMVLNVRLPQQRYLPNMLQAQHAGAQLRDILEALPVKRYGLPRVLE